MELSGAAQALAGTSIWIMGRLLGFINGRFGAAALWPAAGRLPRFCKPCPQFPSLRLWQSAKHGYNGAGSTALGETFETVMEGRRISMTYSPALRRLAGFCW